MGLSRLAHPTIYNEKNSSFRRSTEAQWLAPMGGSGLRDER